MAPTAGEDEYPDQYNCADECEDECEDEPLLGVRAKLNADELFQKSLVGLLNKRGYNIRDSTQGESSGTEDSSITSNSSSVSSLLAGLREPTHGQGPLHIAVRKGDCAVVEALVDNRCAEEIVDLQDHNGNTALHFATGLWRRPECLFMVDKLLGAGASVNLTNKRGLSPVAVHMLTLKVDSPAVLLRLLEHGANPNTEIEGSSLLHIACRREFAMIAGVLVAFRASLTALNPAGLMCFEAASKRVRLFMLRNINDAPPFLSVTQRSKCMRCNSPLLSPKKVIANFFKRLVGGKVSKHQSNCYHCGLLYCCDCLTRTQVPDGFPPSFARSRLDDLKVVKTCPPCEAILVERRHKMHAHRVFDAHLMGFGHAA